MTDLRALPVRWQRIVLHQYVHRDIAFTSVGCFFGVGLRGIYGFARVSFRVGSGFLGGWFRIVSGCIRVDLGWLQGWFRVSVGFLMVCCRVGLVLFWVLFRLGLGNFKGWFRSNLGFCQDFF